MQNFVYLLGDPQTKEAAVVDAAWNVPTILKTLEDEGYRLTHAIFSHGHYDHINGLEEIVEKTDATVVAVASEIEMMAEGGGGMVIPRSSLKKTNSGDTLRLGQLDIQLIHTPGHTPGSQCPYMKANDGGGILLTGDTLFMGTIGRCDFPHSSPKNLYQSLQTLKKLPGDTTFYAGHDYGPKPCTTLALEMKSNPYLMVQSLEEFFQLVRH